MTSFDAALPYFECLRLVIKRCKLFFPVLTWNSFSNDLKLLNIFRKKFSHFLIFLKNRWKSLNRTTSPRFSIYTFLFIWYIIQGCAFNVNCKQLQARIHSFYKMECNLMYILMFFLWKNFSFTHNRICLYFCSGLSAPLSC